MRNIYEMAARRLLFSEGTRETYLTFCLFCFIVVVFKAGLPRPGPPQLKCTTYMFLSVVFRFVQKNIVSAFLLCFLLFYPQHPQICVSYTENRDVQIGVNISPQ